MPAGREVAGGGICAHLAAADRMEEHAGARTRASAIALEHVDLRRPAFIGREQPQRRPQTDVLGDLRHNLDDAVLEIEARIGRDHAGAALVSLRLPARILALSRYGLGHEVQSSAGDSILAGQVPFLLIRIAEVGAASGRVHPRVAGRPDLGVQGAPGEGRRERRFPRRARDGPRAGRSRGGARHSRADYPPDGQDRDGDEPNLHSYVFHLNGTPGVIGRGR